MNANEIRTYTLSKLSPAIDSAPEDTFDVRRWALMNDGASPRAAEALAPYTVESAEEAMRDYYSWEEPEGCRVSAYDWLAGLLH